MPDDLSPAFEPEMVEAPAPKPRRRKAPAEQDIAAAEDAPSDKPRRRRKAAAETADTTLSDNPIDAPAPIPAEKPRRRRSRAEPVAEEPAAQPAETEATSAPTSEPAEEPSFENEISAAEPVESVEDPLLLAAETELFEATAPQPTEAPVEQPEPFVEMAQDEPIYRREALAPDEAGVETELPPAADAAGPVEESWPIEEIEAEGVSPSADETSVALDPPIMAEPPELEPIPILAEAAPDEAQPVEENWPIEGVETEGASASADETSVALDPPIMAEPPELEPIPTLAEAAADEAEPVEENWPIEEVGIEDEVESPVMASPSEPEPMPPQEDSELAMLAEEAAPQDEPPPRDEQIPPSAAEPEDMSMPEPVAPDAGDARRQPTVSVPAAFDESPTLELEPLTEPPDNGPPLVPLGEPDEPEQTEPPTGGGASKAWGPVRGAIETAVSNLGPLLPISRAEQLRHQVAAAIGGQFAKLATLADSLLLSKLPWLKPIGQKIAALIPHSRSTLIGGGLLVAAAVGGVGVRLLLPGSSAPAPALVAEAPRLPSHVARRLGQELEMSVVPMPKGSTALFATGKDQLDSALALSRRQAQGDGIVISLDALVAASRQVLAWYGLDAAITVKPAAGPTLTFQGEVPDSLYPLARAALDNIGQLLTHDPILHTVQIRDQITRSDTVLLRAIFIGDPKSIVYTPDGAREIGQPLYGGFAIRDIEPDDVVLAPAQPGSGITVTIPLREPSAATVHGPALTALPDRSAIVLAQEPTLPAKE